MKPHATVRLYEDGASLHLWHVEGRRGWTGLERDRRARMRSDAIAIAREAGAWTTSAWPSLGRTGMTAEPAHATLVAEWRDGKVSMLGPAGAVARVYLGIPGRRPDGITARTEMLRIRVSDAERAELERAAGDGDLGTWVRDTALRAARRAK